MLTGFSLLLYKWPVMIKLVHKKKKTRDMLCTVVYLTSEGKVPVTGSGGNLKGVFAETDWLLTISIL